MRRHRVAVVVVHAASGALSSACGRGATEQASLPRRVDELERKVDEMWARDHEPPPNASLAISGVVLDTDGKPASVILEANKETDLGEIRLEPRSMTAKTSP